jgi:nucleotide-binding universal stress UspA family protein
MRTILVVFNGINVPWHILNFAINIAKAHSAQIAGIFLRDQEIIYPFPNDLAFTEVDFTRGTVTEEDAVIEGRNITTFENTCKSAGIDCQVNKDVILEELISRSSEADLIVADTTPDFQKYSLNDILKDAHCPICLVSIHTPVVDKVILLYDGSASSKFAIEKYGELFPEWASLSTSVLSINSPTNTRKEIDDFMQNWIPHHFASLDSIELHGNTRQELVKFLQKNEKNILVVMGAFGRSAISRLFHRSLSNVILEETKVSLFTTHK